MTDVGVALARVVRSLCPTLFDDLMDADWSYAASVGVFTVTVDACLDAETCEQIRDRLVTPDPAAEGRRALLRADRDALAPEDPLRRLYDAVLGD